MQKKKTNTNKIFLNKEKVMNLSVTEMASIFGKGDANQFADKQVAQRMPTDPSGTGSVEPPKLHLA